MTKTALLLEGESEEVCRIEVKTVPLRTKFAVHVAACLLYQQPS